MEVQHELHRINPGLHNGDLPRPVIYRSRQRHRKDYVDPDEKWVDEADMALQTAFESIEGEVTELLANSLPKQLGIEVEMKPLKLKLDSNNIDSALDCVEVES